MIVWTLLIILLTVAAALRAVVHLVSRRAMQTAEDSHTVAVPDLGVTLADGGEPQDDMTDEQMREAQLWVEWDRQDVSVRDYTPDEDDRT